MSGHGHGMSEVAQSSIHIHFYRYWRCKRGRRSMPSRDDIDPADIPALLPYISIVHRIDGQYRFRLFGSEMAEQFGRDLTGYVVGSGASNAPQAIAALHAVGEQVYTGARPLFATGRHLTRSGVTQHVSTLLLPLSNDDVAVDKIIFTRLACLASKRKASREWLAGAPFNLGDVVAIAEEADLTQLCLGWEHCCAKEEPIELA